MLYEVEAPADGTVAKLLYALEAVVGVGLPVAIIAEAGEEVSEVAARYADAAAAPVAAPPEPAPVAASTTPPAAEEKRSRVPVTPAARKLAKEHGIDLSGVMTGTGPRGRITREDVQKIIDSGGQAAPPPTPTATPAAAEDIPLRGMRKVIAERMHQSLRDSAQLTISTEVDVTQLIDRRQEVRQEFNVTYTDFIVQACAHALRQHPRMNASLEGECYPYTQRHPRGSGGGSRRGPHCSGCPGGGQKIAQGHCRRGQDFSRESTSQPAQAGRSVGRDVHRVQPGDVRC